MTTNDFMLVSDVGCHHGERAQEPLRGMFLDLLICVFVFKIDVFYTVAVKVIYRFVKIRHVYSDSQAVTNHQSSKGEG